MTPCGGIVSKRWTFTSREMSDETMTSEDEFESLLFQDIDDDQWDKLDTFLVRGSRLPPPSSAPGGSISYERPTEEGEQPIGTQSTFSDGFSFLEAFTDSQNALLDQILASSQPPVQTPSESSHSLEESSGLDIEESIDMPRAPKTLMQLFRPAGTLSVTDLVNPIWWAMCLPVARDTLYAASNSSS